MSTVAFAPAPSHARLVLVELRKMTDTRSGFWLLLANLGIVVGLFVIMLVFAPAREQTFVDFVKGAVGLTAVLMPVLGILAVTSEWSQRTALTTFTLVPRRERVIAAKLLATIALGLLAVAICLQAAVIANLLSTSIGDGSGRWAFGPSELVNATLSEVLPLLGGLAFGLALMRSAPAIVMYFLAPTVFGIAAGIIPGFKGTAEWLDLWQVMGHLNENTMTGQRWAQLGTALCIWLLAPLAIGLWRLHRRELA